jgi:hypothetical protein
MIVISDLDDLVKNQLDKNFQPVELGYDRSGNFMTTNFLLNFR